MATRVLAKAKSSSFISKWKKQMSSFHDDKTATSFFATIATIFYLIVIGTFGASFILFLVLGLIKPHISFNNLAFYSGLVSVVFFISAAINYYQQKKLHARYLKANEAEKLRLQKQLKAQWMFTLVATVWVSLMLSFFMMILIGSFDGLGLYFANHPGIWALTTNLYQTKVTGLVLFFLTLFASAFLFIVVHVYQKLKLKANKILTHRRKIVAAVHAQAEQAV